MSRKIVLCTPRKAADHPKYKDAVDAFVAAAPADVELIMFNIQSGLVKSRDTACSYAMHINADDVLMWDNDISEDADKVWHMMSHDVDIVGAPYTTKEHPARWVMSAHPDAPSVRADGLWPVYEIGTGLKRYRVSALRKMCETYPGLEYEPMDGNLLDVARWNLHFMGVVNRRWLSEDFGFDFIARNSGFTIFCDTALRPKHWGTVGYPLEEPSLVPDLVVEKDVVVAQD